MINVTSDLCLLILCLITRLSGILGVSPLAQRVEHLPAMQETGFDPWVRKIPWRRQWHPTPVLLPGKSHGWRSLVDYSPWNHKESDTTERFWYFGTTVR